MGRRIYEGMTKLKVYLSYSSHYNSNILERCVLSDGTKELIYLK